jgi:hypothetical protein
MYCPGCGKEILSDTKFCPQCGKAVDSASGKPAHPALSIFLIGLILSVVHVIIRGASASSGKDMTGLDVGFGLLYLFLFILFIAALFSKQNKPAMAIDKKVAVKNQESPQKKPSGRGKRIVAVVLILAITSFVIYVGSGSASPLVITIFIIAFLAAIIGFLWHFIKKHQGNLVNMFQKIVNTVKFLIHHPVLTIFSTIVGVVLVLFIYSIVVESNYKSLENSLPKIQDNLSEAATAKLMGDSLMAGYGISGMGMGKIATTAKTTSDNLKQLSSPGALKSYKEVAVAWSDTIAGAATKTTTWKDLSETPAVFNLSLNDNKVNEYIETSLQKIAKLKEAGDIAIKRQDRQTMYYIAGQLLVQEYWLDGVMHSANPGTLSLKIDLFPSALAWFPGPVNRKWMCTSRTVAARCGNTNPVDLAKAIRQAAVEYVAAKPGADEQWNKVTADQLKVPTDQGQYTETQGGVYNGEPNLPPQLSPTEKVFVDECKAKGGTTGGTGGVYARMPTTETGIACHHGNGCWDYLTRSNRSYSGGNQGCPEENLLPPPPPPSPSPRASTQAPSQRPQNPESPQKSQVPQNPTGASWDGIYNLSESGSCGGSQLGNIFSGVFANRITVQNNRVNYPNFGSAPIDSSGNAQISLNMSQSGISVSGRQTFHFSRSGNGAAVQGTMNLSAMGVSCTINSSGTRQ